MTNQNMDGLPSDLAEFLDEVLNCDEEDLGDSATKEQVLERIKSTIKTAGRFIELQAKYPQFAARR